MKFDLMLDSDSTGYPPGKRDLTPGLVSGRDEIRQRILTRLARVKGEWFLNNQSGLPYYDFEGNFFLLGKQRQGELILRLMEEALRTDGVKSVTDVELKGTRNDETIGRMSVALDDNSELLLSMDSLGGWS